MNNDRATLGAVICMTAACGVDPIERRQGDQEVRRC
jgi:hypothetical protein